MVMRTSALQPPRPEPVSRRKATQFCPHCGYENPIDGDWTVIETEGHARFECPDCGETVISQPVVQPGTSE